MAGCFLFGTGDGVGGQHLLLGGIRLFFQEGSLETAGTDALSPGLVWEEQPQGPLTRLPPEGRFYLFEQLGLAIPLGQGRVFLVLSFQAPDLGWAEMYTDPLLLLSLGRKCEKTGPRSVP